MEELMKCELCGDEYAENVNFYDDTCDECARSEGLYMPDED